MSKDVIKWGERSPAKNDWGVRCYHSHPELPITVAGGTYTVLGGSCGTPVYDDCDVYVGLDHSMADHQQRLPWVEGHAVHYRIQDGSVPKDANEFKQLIDWLADQVLDNKKVHVGCIGGHGRTGMVLAALVAHMTKDDLAKVDDPITYVRTHYCKKVVESTSQVEFLMTHFGAKKVEPSKQHTWATGQKKVTSMQRAGAMYSPIDGADALIWGDWKIEG